MIDTTGLCERDAEFLRALYGCLPALRRRLRRRLRGMPGVDVDDVIQDVVLRAWTRRATIDTAKLAAWCSATAFNRATDLGRTWDDGSHHVPVADMTETCEATGETSPDPVDLVLAHEDAAAIKAKVRDALDALPPSWRAVLEAAEFRNLSPAEIAAEMAMTKNNVNVVLHRARVRLRETLSPVHLSALPGLAARPFRALRRALGPAQMPAPAFAYSTAMIVTLSAVLQYAVPLGSTPAEADTMTDLPRIAATTLPVRSSEPATALTPASDPLSRPLPVPAPSKQQGPQPSEPPCPVTCLVPPVPTPPTNTENGDQITVNVPAPLDETAGPVGVREAYVPVCDHWIDNPAASCTRHGRPDWTVPPPNHPDHPDHPDHHVK